MKPLQKKILFFGLAIAGMFVFPFLGAVIANHGDIHLPPHFFDYPPTAPRTDTAPFSWIIFGIMAAIFLFVATLYIMPSWFGFKKTIPAPRTPSRPDFPWWFWLGVIMWGVPLILLWTHRPWPHLGWLLKFSDIPLFWGFILILDGYAYKRGGHSMMSTNPRELIGIGVASVSGWMVFDFLNFFIHMNWYYPFGNNLDGREFLLYALIGSSGFLPMAFEWYYLLRTFEGIRNRFSNGPKWNPKLWVKILVLVLSYVMLFFMGVNPNTFFYFVWLGPVIILTYMLEFVGIWTPFRPIIQGNWSYFLIFALTFLFQGIILEFENYVSAARNAAGVPILCQSPAFWMYHLPYVHRYCVFEMPLLGYLGYLPFSVYCWLWWIMVAFLLNINKNQFYQMDTRQQTKNEINTDGINNEDAGKVAEPIVATN